MIRIEVDSIEVTEQKGTTSKGKPYNIRKQGAYAFVLGPDGKEAKYPVRMVVNLEQEQKPYPVGFYTLDPKCIVVGDFDQLAFGRLALRPAGQSAQNSGAK